MTLSLRTTLRSLSLLVLTAAFVPGCDGEEFEAHGLSVEDIDSMSEEELDELAALEDLRPGGPDEPDPSHPGINPGQLTSPTAHSHQRPQAADDLWNPRHTHGHDRPEAAEDLWNPRHTHAHQRPDTVPGVVNPDHPTHGSNLDPVAQLAGEADEGCDTHADDDDYSNG